MTKRSLIFLVVALGGLVGWLGGVYAYTHWFSETGRAGGDVIKVAMWTSALVGLASTIAFGVSLWRTPRA